MRFGVLGACVALTAFLAATVAGSLWTAVLERLLGWFTETWTGVGRRRLLLALRLLPLTVGLLFAGTLMTPAWVDLEPPDTQEHLGWALALLTCLAAGLLADGVARGWRSWRMSQRLASAWMDRGTPIRLARLDLPAYQIEASFPVVSVVGTRRPRLFIDSRVLDALTPGELAAAVAHEAAHVRGHDNWLRLLFLSCPDVLGRFAPGHRLERGWDQACEAAADERVGVGAALDLASVLVKVARLAQGGVPRLVASHIYDATGDIAERVNRLLARADGRPLPPPSGWSRVGAWTTVAALPVLVALLATTDQAQAAVHVLAEFLVRLV